MAHRRGFAVSIVFKMALLTLMLTTPVLASQAPPASASYPTAIMQLIAGAGTFTGTLTTNGFALNGVISVVGTISGKLTDTAGNVIGTINAQPVTILLASFTGTCTTLTLHTGPITLSVASGSAVSLNPIDVVIAAVSVPDNQLGALLCSLVNLLSSNPPLADVVTRLNDILGAIRV